MNEKYFKYQRETQSKTCPKWVSRRGNALIRGIRETLGIDLEIKMIIGRAMLV